MQIQETLNCIAVCTRDKTQSQILFPCWKMGNTQCCDLFVKAFSKNNETANLCWKIAPSDRYRPLGEFLPYIQTMVVREMPARRFHITFQIKCHHPFSPQTGILQTPLPKLNLCDRGPNNCSGSLCDHKCVGYF